MEKIYQSRDVAFHAPTLKDAVTMLPLMDALVNLINHNRIYEVYNNLDEVEKDLYKRVWSESNISLSTAAAEKILWLLGEMGFESQNEIIIASTDNLQSK